MNFLLIYSKNDQTYCCIQLLSFYLPNVCIIFVPNLEEIQTVIY